MCEDGFRKEEVGGTVVQVAKCRQETLRWAWMGGAVGTREAQEVWVTL
jgi:hypothetical protein